ncbi:tRNA (adenosine(37)-N6)-dimethylallyltransferase MiaA [Sutcliffiella horikoshii]|mgnify:FL=1|uniref:tRNA (adenosine(37)-N6)-dimethylallyltransferase MiaA n=1 Tax=Sutcliffiella horikoshii TaxID=79883 RepID=UPI001CBAA6A5|nr:tRNA (adenosine(37)-N6)-dimethylallyltransferase MiaA [Sutcliffiella horikoshii]UAL49241.1 tRNA (adenosine(37)-N6)-dimethylallyltransferase MiaA [Sutcliffiella horikoshii]
MGEKQKVIVIIGPTAVGKTKTSVELAKRLNGEIISGDSMQIYKTMDIGTAKVKKEEMQGIPHFLIDIKEPKEAYSVAEFQQDVRNKIDEITSRGRIPIIVGGTGLYIQSVLYDYQFSESGKDEEIRLRLEKRSQEIGVEKLHQELNEIDPKSAANIHPNNVRRVIRALEIFYTTGKTMSEYQDTQQPEPLYDIALIGLTMERERLYERINLRVDLMMEEGLLKEVQTLYNNEIRDCQSIQAIGYKELYAYFDGKVTLEQAVNDLKQNSRRYAKRQHTWFRNKMDVTWFDMTDADFEQKLSQIFTVIAGKLRLGANK